MSLRILLSFTTSSRSSLTAGAGAATGAGATGAGATGAAATGAGAGVGAGATGAGAGAGAATGAGAALAAIASMRSSTSSRVIRPPGPVPTSDAVSMLCSATRRRTTGDNKRLSSTPAATAAADATAAATGLTGAAAGAGATTGATGATGAGAGGGGGGAGTSTTTGAGAGAGVGAGAGAAPSAAPTTAMIAPTGTVSPSWARISSNTPLLGAGTSVSTLSVDTSNNGSSTVTASPTFLNQRVIVPSVTVSPSCGNVMSAMKSFQILHCVRANQLLRLRPVRDNIVSPNSSLRLGCG